MIEQAVLCDMQSECKAQYLGLMAFLTIWTVFFFENAAERNLSQKDKIHLENNFDYMNSKQS